MQAHQERQHKTHQAREHMSMQVHQAHNLANSTNIYR